jgi:uncharacterized membrane protein YkvA (DUF1232 family)
MSVSLLIGFGIALICVWVALCVVVFVLRPPGQSIREVVRVLPDALRLAAALYRDPTVPRAARWRLWIALIYNVQPINLVPDVIPVIGFADNVAVLAWALRGTIRIAGADTVRRHWKGSPGSLATLYRVLRLSPQGSNTGGRDERAGTRQCEEVHLGESCPHTVLSPTGRRTSAS